jgi:hypothetical protein
VRSASPVSAADADDVAPFSRAGPDDTPRGGLGERKQEGGILRTPSLRLRRLSVLELAFDPTEHGRRDARHVLIPGASSNASQLARAPVGERRLRG